MPKGNNAQKAANKAGMGSMVQPIIMMCLAVVISLVIAFLNIFPYSMSLLCEYAKENPKKVWVAQKWAWITSSSAIKIADSISIPTDVFEICSKLEKINLVVTSTNSITPMYSSTVPYQAPANWEAGDKPDTSSANGPPEFDAQRCAGGVTITREELQDMGFARVKPEVLVYADPQGAESFKALINKWNTQKIPQLWEAKNPGKTFDLEKYTNQIVLSSYSRQASKAHRSGIAFDYSNPDYHILLTNTEKDECVCKDIPKQPKGADGKSEWDRCMEQRRTRQGFYPNTPACQTMINKWKNEIDTYEDEFRVFAQKEGWSWGGDFTNNGGRQLYYDPVHLDLAGAPSMRSCGGNTTNRVTVIRACEASLKCG